MKTHLLKITALMLVLCGTFYSCEEKIVDNTNTGIRNKFIVDKIYDYNNNLLADYIYDDSNRLLKRIITSLSVHPIQTVETWSEDKFEYRNGRVSKITNDTRQYYTYPGNGQEYSRDYHGETTFEYDSQGKLTKTNGCDLNFHYNENGRIVSVGTNIEPYINTIVYDGSGNITEHIYILPELDMVGRPIEGTTRKVVYQYEYDNKPKPNFGLDYLLTWQPLPQMGNETDYAMEFSPNNLTKYVNSGTTWSYTYNEYGLPKTIETKWFSSETLEPMLLRITYKQIE